MVFEPKLQQQTGCRSDFAVGVTLRALIDDYLSRHGAVRAQLLDEDGRLRRDVVVLIDGRQLEDRESLTDRVAAASEVYVMQATGDEY